MWDDGTYDAVIIDATVTTTETGRIVELELTITAGDHKGEVVPLRADGLAGEEWDLLGMPATLTVTGGVPHIQLDV